MTSAAGSEVKGWGDEGSERVREKEKKREREKEREIILIYTDIED